MSRPGRLSAAGLLALAVLACRERDAARQAELERAVAAAEGGAPAPAPSATGRAPRAPQVTASETPAPPLSPDQPAWAAAITRDLDGLARRSRQRLSVALMRERRDPLQKSEDLIAHMQWCDEGSLEACLHAGHVLLFNECLFDRGYALYVAGQALARDLPAAAIDDSTVDGRPLRAELQLGLRMGDPANRDEQQVQAIARVCGAVAERDRPWWDEVFAGYQRGERTPETTPSTDMESVALGAIRKELLMGAETRIATLESLAGGAAGGLRLTLARVAGELCASDDPVSCATAAYLQGGACRLDEMTAAYRAFETGLSRLDPRSRELAFNLGRDVTWQARAYVEADERTRDELRRSICARH